MYNNDSNSLNAGAPDLRLTGNQRMASAPDPTAEMNDFSMQVFGKPLHQLTPPQLDALYELMNEQSKAPQQNSGIMASAPGTYTQNRKRQMAAGGGIMGSNNGSMLVAPTADGSRPGYGWLSDLKDKFVDDIIPNELKSPAALATIAGLGLNQFGIPFTQGDVGERMGQNWLGELLGNIPGVQGGTVDTVLGGGGGGQSIMDIFRPETISTNPVGGLDQLAKDIIRSQGGDYVKDLYGITGVIDYDSDSDYTLGDPEIAEGATGTLKNFLTKQIQQEAVKKLTGQSNQSGSGITQAISSAASPYLGTDKDRRVNPLYPLGIGAAVGKYVEGLPKDKIQGFGGKGMDLASIRGPAQESQAAAKAAGLYFTPEDETRLASAQGGRIGYADGTGSRNKMSALMFKLSNGTITGEEMIELRNLQSSSGFSSANKAQGGRIGAEKGGLMNLGGMEKDYRNEGGFVALGGEEKADDVPARLSKNEFVFTADAVRGAGGGDIDQGAEIMENMMKHLESGGEVSEDSQGLEGARGMFANAQKLQNRIV